MIIVVSRIHRRVGNISLHLLLAIVQMTTATLSARLKSSHATSSHSSNFVLKLMPGKLPSASFNSAGILVKQICSLTVTMPTSRIYIVPTYSASLAGAEKNMRKHKISGRSGTP